MIRGKIDVMTPEVVEAFDECGISYRNTVYLIATITNALGIDAESLILNKTSFNNSRANIRKIKAEKVEALFNEKDLPYAIIHWDGKLIPDRFSFKKVDRLQILVSVEDEVKTLDVPAL